MEESRLGLWLERNLPTLLLFIIRIVEVFAASIVPSVLSVIVIFLAPSERSWSVLSVFCFIKTTAVNWYFWLDFAVERESVKQFYIINGIVQAIYIAASIVGYFFLGYLVYSMTFANLRIFEVFEMKTIHSVLITDGISVLVMIACERWSRAHIDKIREVLKKNGADKVEMEDKSESIVPTKQDRAIETLSVEEMAEEIVRDEEERLEAAREAAESEPEELWNDDISKGHGETIVRVDYSEEGTDTDENDFVPGAEVNENEDYEADSLWNSEIYEGRTEGGKPVTDFEDELNELPPEPAEDEPLWDEAFYRQRGNAEELERIYAEEEATAAPEEVPYDADSLWNSDFYRGTDKNDIPERVLDLSDEPEDIPEDSSEDGYAPDALWDNVGRAIGDDMPENEEPINPNMDYDTDSLWSKDMHMGKENK